MSTTAPPTARAPAAQATAYLSLLRLRLDHTGVRRDLKDLDGMHHKIMSLYDEHPDGRQGLGVLYRATADEPRGEAAVLIQSFAEPDWQRLDERQLAAAPQTRSMDPLLDRLEPGSAWRFEINANPVIAKNQGNNKRGTRVPIAGETNQLAWLRRQIGQHGIVLADAIVATSPIATLGWREKGQRPVKIVAVRFTGTLTIVEPEPARQLLLTGLGRGKAYGCGLLTLAPVV